MTNKKNLCLSYLDMGVIDFDKFKNSFGVYSFWTFIENCSFGG